MYFNSLRLSANMFCIALRLVQKKTRIGYEKGNSGNKYPHQTLASIEKEILKTLLKIISTYNLTLFVAVTIP